MNVLAINGSPRKDGNTSVLIKTVFEELEAQEIETKEINVGSKLIRGCIACMKCWENQDGHCAQKKDPLNDWLLKSIDASKDQIPEPQTTMSVMTNFIR